VASSTFSFALNAGPICRSWDDFLTVSAQRWSDLREELTSGRLAAFLAGIGRSDLAPDPYAPGTPDERLDAWIGRLPTTKPAQPELDVHPRVLALRIAPGGGETRRKLQLHNTGHRLLRATATIEPAGTPWIRVAPECAGKPIVAVEDAELPLAITIPESYRGTLQATVLVESNGGSRRVPVTLEPPAALDEIPAASAAVARPVDLGIRSWVTKQSMQTRLIAWPATALVIRLVIGIAANIGPGDVAVSPALLGPALLLAIAGACLGCLLAVRREAWKELPSCGFAGAVLGVLIASIGVAVCRAVEPILGPTLAGSLIATTILWGLIGLAAAGTSLALWPPKRVQEVKP
jgi:hypothetical protein